MRRYRYYSNWRFYAINRSDNNERKESFEIYSDIPLNSDSKKPCVKNVKNVLKSVAEKLRQRARQRENFSYDTIYSFYNSFSMSTDYIRGKQFYYVFDVKGTVNWDLTRLEYKITQTRHYNWQYSGEKDETEKVLNEGKIFFPCLEPKKKRSKDPEKCPQKVTVKDMYVGQILNIYCALDNWHNTKKSKRKVIVTGFRKVEGVIYPNLIWYKRSWGEPCWESLYDIKVLKGITIPTSKEESAKIISENLQRIDSQNIFKKDLLGKGMIVDGELHKIISYQYRYKKDWDYMENEHTMEITTVSIKKKEDKNYGYRTYGTSSGSIKTTDMEDFNNSLKKATDISAEDLLKV